jgi:hypothetical protein
MHKYANVVSKYSDEYGMVSDDFHAVVFVGDVEIANGYAGQMSDKHSMEHFKVESVGECESIEAFAKANDGVWVVDVANKRVGFFYDGDNIEDINWEADSGIVFIDRFIR